MKARNGRIIACSVFLCKEQENMEKEPSPEVEETEKKDSEKQVVWSPTAVTFEELDGLEVAFEQVNKTTELIEKFHILVDNTMWSEEIEDKGAHVGEIASELSSRLQTINSGSEDKEGILDTVKSAVKGLFTDEEPEAKKGNAFMLVKNSDGEWLWFARYSNKWRDEDSPPEIISEQSHRRFVDLVDKELAPLPELWLWHVPNTMWGKARWVGYDSSGFALAAGYVYPEFNEVAETLNGRDDILLSHGMPTKTIKRDANDPSIIIEHETREISPLPSKAAANKMTSFVVLKETDMEELKDKGISAEDKLKLVEELSIPESIVNKMEADDLKDATLATAAGLEFKEGDVKQVADTELETETAVVEEEQDNLEPEETVDGANALEEDVETDIEETVGLLTTAVEALNLKISSYHDNMLKEIEAIKSSQDEAIQQIASTPMASRAASVLESVVGKEATRLDGRTSLAKDAPKENEEDGSGRPFFFQKKGF